MDRSFRFVSSTWNIMTRYLLDGKIRRLYLKVQRLTVYHFKNVF